MYPARLPKSHASPFTSLLIVLRCNHQFDISVYQMEGLLLYTYSPRILTLDIQTQATPGWHPFLRASVPLTERALFSPTFLTADLQVSVSQKLSLPSEPPHPRVHSCPSLRAPALLVAVRGCLIKTTSHHPGGRGGTVAAVSGALKTRHRC